MLRSHNESILSYHLRHISGLYNHLGIASVVLRIVLWILIGYRHLPVLLVFLNSRKWIKWNRWTERADSICLIVFFENLSFRFCLWLRWISLLFLSLNFLGFIDLFKSVYHKGLVFILYNIFSILIWFENFLKIYDEILNIWPLFAQSLRKKSDAHEIDFERAIRNLIQHHQILFLNLAVLGQIVHVIGGIVYYSRFLGYLDNALLEHRFMEAVCRNENLFLQGALDLSSKILIPLLTMLRIDIMFRTIPAMNYYEIWFYHG